MADLLSTMKISGAGMRAQSERVRVIAQNMANADTAPTKPGSFPYTRKTISFKNHMDRDIGAEMVSVDKISQDKSSDYVKNICRTPRSRCRRLRDDAECCLFDRGDGYA